MSSDYQLEDTVFLPFTTRAFATGIPTALLGTPLIDIYEDADATPIVTSETLVVSLNSKVGFNMITVTATAASGFEAGKSYTALINAGTVDSVSVIGEVVAHFTLDMSGAAKDLANATDGLSALRTLLLDIPTVSEFNARTLLTADYFDPTADTVATVTTLTGHTPQTGDSFARIGVAGAGLTDITINAASIDLFWDEPLTGLNHNVVDSGARRLRDLQEFGVYEGGAVWIDTVNGTAGTTTFENGTAFNDSLTLADAIILAAAVPLMRFQVAPGSTIAFAEAHTNEVWKGEGAILTLGTSAITGSSFVGFDISGIGTGAFHEMHDCHIGITTIAGGQLLGCAIEDTLTLSAGGDYTLFNCFHNEAGAPSSIDFGAAVGASQVHIHNWHGNLTILNMLAGDILHFTCADGTLTMDASCTGGTRNSAGTFGLTDNSSGMTVNDLGQMYQRIGAPVGADISADIAATATPADVNAQVLDVLNIDTFALPGQEAPPLAPTLVECATWLYKVFRNETDQTATLWQLKADDGSTVDARAVVSDDATTATKEKVGSGP